jgi:hypothetical protein
VRSLRESDHLSQDTRALDEVIEEDKQRGVFVARAPEWDQEQERISAVLDRQRHAEEEKWVDDGHRVLAESRPETPRVLAEQARPCGTVRKRSPHLTVRVSPFVLNDGIGDPSQSVPGIVQAPGEVDVLASGE